MGAARKGPLKSLVKVIGELPQRFHVFVVEFVRMRSQRFSTGISLVSTISCHVVGLATVPVDSGEQDSHATKG
jgi:hypothetical protein